MRLQVELKRLGSRGRKVAPVPFEVEGVPATVGELIAATAKKCAEEYNERVRKGETRITPLSEREITDMAGVGNRVFLGFNEPGKNVFDANIDVGKLDIDQEMAKVQGEIDDIKTLITMMLNLKMYG